MVGVKQSQPDIWDILLEYLPLKRSLHRQRGRVVKALELGSNPPSSGKPREFEPHRCQHVFRFFFFFGLYEYRRATLEWH